MKNLIRLDHSFCAQLNILWIWMFSLFWNWNQSNSMKNYGDTFILPMKEIYSAFIYFLLYRDLTNIWRESSYTF